MKQILTALLLAALFLHSSDARGCTGIYAFQNGLALAGNNEDYWNWNTRMWFVPAENGTYGRVYFGFDNGFPQGGMNEAGLFFDGFATAPEKVTGGSGKPRFDGNLIDAAMAECATVEEVVALFRAHNLEFMERAMLMFGDREGDSVIIEGDAFVRKQGRHQVTTNFYQSLTGPENYTCPRYRIATSMLDEAEQISVELFRRILAAAHVELVSPTQYSNVYDLTHGIVYLYHYHNFANEVEIRLDEELKKGAHAVDIPDLFPETFAFSMFQDWKRGEIEKEKAKRRARVLSAEELESYTGEYTLAIEGYGDYPVTILRKEDRLYSRNPDGEETELVPQGDDRFFAIDLDGTADVIFRRSEEGRVIGCVLEQGGRRFEGKRAE